MKVIVVDDEPNIREGLQYIIDWSALGCEIVAEAKDAYEGLEKISQHQPDIVISDVRMPYLTGIEMIYQAKKISPETEYILLSGYSDFQYAQEAIRHGVSSYLLKPIEEEELEEAIKQIIQKKDLKVQAEKMSTSYHEIQKTRLIKEWLVHNEEHQVLEGMELMGSFQLIEILPLRKNISRELFEQIIKNYISQQDYYFRHGDNYYVLFTKLDKKIQKIELDVLCQLFNSHGIEIDTIFISSLISESEQLPYAYKKIIQNHRYLFLLDNIKIISDDELIKMQQQLKNDDLSEPTTVFERIEQHLVMDQLLVFNDVYEALIRYYRQSSFSENEIKVALCNGAISIINEVVVKKGLNVPEILRYEVIERLMGTKKLSDALEQVIQFLKKIQVLVENENELEGDVVQQIIKYTAQHYQENLTLQRLGELFGYNSSYLGKKFKRELAISYSNYLDKVRIEAAKRMLTDTNLLIYEISEKVGYTSLDYFHKKFKNHTNMSPKIYRKTVGKRNDYG